MEARRFVGRIGPCAAALGIGAAVLVSGSGRAAADTVESAGDSPPSSEPVRSDAAGESTNEPNVTDSAAQLAETITEDDAADAEDSAASRESAESEMIPPGSDQEADLSPVAREPELSAADTPRSVPPAPEDLTPVTDDGTVPGAAPDRNQDPIAAASTPARQQRSTWAASNPVIDFFGRLASFFNNRTPQISPVQTAQSADGVVTGLLNPVDPDSARLTFTVAEEPEHGSATVSPDGTWTYIPNPGAAATGVTDWFRVKVSDAASGFAIHGLAGLIHLLSFGLFGTRGDSSTAVVAVIVTPAGQQPPPASSQLDPDALTFEGFFRVPTGSLSGGPYANLSYGGMAMASRVVGGERRFFLTGHRYGNDPLIELIAPDSLGRTAGDAPVATLFRYWGDIYRGRKVTAEEPNGFEPNANWTEGLLWDDAGQRLLWSYGNWYAASAVNNPVLGATTLGEDGTVSVQGPWRTTADSQQTRSFAVNLSSALSAVTGGATLGLGGKMQSINAAASWGISLHAVELADSLAAGTTVSVHTLASHPIAPTRQRGLRQPDYEVARNPDGSLDAAGTEPAVGGVGYWTELDETTGAVFVSTGTSNTLVYAGGQASGLIWYGPDFEHGIRDGRGSVGTGNHAQSYRPVLWFVSGADLIASAQGRLQPHEVNPYATIDLVASFPELAFLSGLSAGQPVFAEDEGLLYVPFPGGVAEGQSPYPIVAVFSVSD
ncbi:MAG: Ig-like domain-containing protein [Mycolicibacterium sp.]|uniref:Ig-like domain-containing protein n=1 Tax=Mycolicibacterium sp. TaxID=2320850 RepID=UPI003D0FFB71